MSAIAKNNVFYGAVEPIPINDGSTSATETWSGQYLNQEFSAINSTLGDSLVISGRLNVCKINGWLMMNGTTPSLTAEGWNLGVFQLPADIRPASQVNFACVSGSGTAATVGRISTQGSVDVYRPSGQTNAFACVISCCVKI